VTGKKRVLDRVLMAGGALLGGYCLLCALAWWLQDRLIYIPSREIEADPSAAGLLFRDLLLHLPAGGRVHAWHVPHPKARGTVLFCHGNAGNVSHRVGLLAQLHVLRLSVLIFDYPGFGKSDGRPSEAGCQAAAEAVWAWLTGELGEKPERVVVWGRSLGSTVAVRLAAERAPAALVVEASMTSAVDAGKRHYPWLPVGLLMRNRHAAIEHMAAVRCRKLFFHSRDDEVIPFELGQRLFAAAGEPKRFVELVGRHNECYQQSGERYGRPLRAFLDEVLGL
jgi:alpha-beta hydrolase superfamily lysophospholipase